MMGDYDAEMAGSMEEMKERMKEMVGELMMWKEKMNEKKDMMKMRKPEMFDDEGKMKDDDKERMMRCMKKMEGDYEKEEDMCNMMKEGMDEDMMKKKMDM